MTDTQTTEEAPGLWDGDTGSLAEDSRRALLALIRGPYVSHDRNAKLWSALLRDEEAIRARLSELFLELLIDQTGLVAYVRNVEAPDVELPKTVRTAPLTFLDTALLLVLRQHLVSTGTGERVIVGKDDITEQLNIYRDKASDEAGFQKRVSASWSNMKKYGLITDTTGGEERVEISPVLRLVFGPEQIAAVRAEYRRLGNEGSDGGGE